MEFRQIELYFVFFFMECRQIILFVLWNVIRLYCLFLWSVLRLYRLFRKKDLDSRRVQRGHSIGVPPAKKKN